MRPFVATLYPEDIDESPATAPEEVASFEMPARNLDGEAGSQLADLTEVTTLTIQTACVTTGFFVRRGWWLESLVLFQLITYIH